MIDFHGMFDDPVQVALGLVVAPAPNALAPTAAHLVSILLQPGNHPAEARAAVLGAGAGKGVFVRYMPGEEVLVLLANGDPNRAVILGSLHNLANPAIGWLAARMLIQDPLGVELRSAPAIPADGIVLGTFLVAFQTYTAAISTFMTAMVAAGSLAPASAGTAAMGAAATAFQAATATFLASLATSALYVDPATGGLGGAPFASTLVRSTL